MVFIKLLMLWGFALKALCAGMLFSVDESEIKIFFSNQNTTKVLTNISDPNDVAKTGFSKKKKTVFCVNTVFEFPSISDSCEDIRVPLLQKYDVNYFHIDWRIISNNPLTAYFSIQEVSEIASRKITNMAQTSGLDLNQSQAIGTSYAAQLVGRIGQKLGGKFGQIIGLDPGISGLNTTDHISKNSGQFVHVIHTGGSKCGLIRLKPLGHADYYANGGSKQPGCTYELLGLCSHMRVVQLYVKTLLNSTQFLATRCDSKENYNNGMCDNNDKSYVGGFSVNTEACGSYQFKDETAYESKFGNLL